MRSLSAIVLGFALVGSAAAQDDNAKKIVGKWEITKTTSDAPVGTVIEFTKDGKLMIAAKIDGQELKLEGTYKVEKDKLHTEVKIGDRAEKDTDTIKKLTDDEMELEDKDKKMITLKKKK